MEENSKASVTFVDLIKLFQKKFKVLVVVGLLAAILGGLCGAFLTVQATTYRAEIEISVSPTDGSDDILYFLRSGRFAEQMLLEENGLPARDECNAADYDAALKLLEELDVIRRQRIEKNKEVARHYISDVENHYKGLTDEYNGVLTLLKMYKEAQADALVSDTHEAMIAVYEEKLAKAEGARKDYYDNYYAPAVAKKLQLSIELSRLTDAFVDTKQEAAAAVEKVLSDWRQKNGVAGRTSAFMSYVSYEIKGLDEETAKDAASQPLGSSYIRIKIAVPADAVPATYASGGEYVRSLVDRLETRLDDVICSYLEDDLTVFEGSCVQTNPVISISQGPGGVTNAAIKYGIVFAMVGVVLAYAFCIMQYVVKAEDEAKAAPSDGAEADPADKKK